MNKMELEASLRNMNIVMYCYVRHLIGKKGALKVYNALEHLLFH